MLLLESNKYSQNAADLLKYKQILKTYFTVEGFFAAKQLSKNSKTKILEKQN